jgi:nucleoside-diphosphate-sugar epimerase
VRTLDLAPLDGSLVAAGAEALTADVRDPAAAQRLCEGADVLVHAAAALPIQGSASAIRSVNVEGTATVLEAARDRAVRRVVFVSTTAVYGVPVHHPVTEDTPLDPIGAYGESKADAEALCRRLSSDAVVLRPKTFLGAERLGVFEILFEWVREGRRVYTIGAGQNRFQLLAVEDLVEAVVLAAERRVGGETLNVGAARFGTVAEDLGALIAHAGSTSRLTPLPARPVQAVLRGLEVIHASPLAEWHYRTAATESVVSIAKAEQMLGWKPQRSNVQTLTAAYDWYAANAERLGEASGVTHRTPWRRKALGVVKRLS